MSIKEPQVMHGGLNISNVIDVQFIKDPPFEEVPQVRKFSLNDYLDEYLKDDTPKPDAPQINK